MTPWKITLYEDNDIEVYSDGLMKHIERKSNKNDLDIIRDLALKYKYMSDLLGLFLTEYNIDKDDFAEKAHKTFGFYKKFNDKFVEDALQKIAETMEI